MYMEIYYNAYILTRIYHGIQIVNESEEKEGEEKHTRRLKLEPNYRNRIQM